MEGEELQRKMARWSPQTSIRVAVMALLGATSACGPASTSTPVSPAPKATPTAEIRGPEEELAKWEEATHLNAEDTTTWLNKGNVLIRLGRYEEALETYDEAIRIKPDFPEAWFTKGAALVHLSRWEEALKAYDEATRLRPDYAVAWNNKGFVMDKLGLYQEALKAYDEAVRAQPNYAMAWYNKGFALDKLHRQPEAQQSFCLAWRERRQLPDGGQRVDWKTLGVGEEQCAGVANPREAGEARTPSPTVEPRTPSPTVASTSTPVPPAPKVTPTAQAVPTKVAVIAFDVVNVRSGPSVNSSIISQVKYGEKLPILGQDKDWYKVKLPDGREGYVAARFFVGATGP